MFRFWKLGNQLGSPSQSSGARHSTWSSFSTTLHLCGILREDEHKKRWPSKGHLKKISDIWLIRATSPTEPDYLNQVEWLLVTAKSIKATLKTLQMQHEQGNAGVHPCQTPGPNLAGKGKPLKIPKCGPCLSKLPKHYPICQSCRNNTQVKAADGLTNFTTRDTAQTSHESPQHKGVEGLWETKG